MMVNKLYMYLWLLVVSLLLYRGTPLAIDLYPKEKIVDYHSINVTMGMVYFVDNKDQLAAVIGHEVAHIILGHTKENTHKPENEYQADMIGMFLAHKAGFSACGMDSLWRRVGERSLSLHSGTHPNAFIRSYYLEMPECKGLPVKKEAVSLWDAHVVFEKIIKNVEGKIRYKTLFNINLDMSINAFVYSVLKDRGE